MEKITRRAALSTLATGFATAAAVAAPAAVEVARPVQQTSIPTTALAKIKAWQEAMRAGNAATAAYSDSLRVKPINKAECDQCYRAMAAANEAVGPARDEMMRALSRL